MAVTGVGAGVAAALSGVGCGGSDNGAVIASGPPEAGSLGTDPEGEAGTSPDGGGATDSSSPKRDGGGSDADAAPKDNRIDPIEVGHAWTYNVTVLGFYPACSNGVFVSNTLGSSTLDGKTALEVQSFCENAGTVKYSVDGDRVYAHLGSSWRISLDAPVAEGHTWTDGYLDYKWKSKGSITTPAGTFDDCWSATTVANYASYITLCRGVGPVRWHYDNGFGNGYDAVLTAKNF